MEPRTVQLTQPIKTIKLGEIDSITLQLPLARMFINYGDFIHRVNGGEYPNRMTENVVDYKIAAKYISDMSGINDPNVIGNMSAYDIQIITSIVAEMCHTNPQMPSE